MNISMKVNAISHTGNALWLIILLIWARPILAQTPAVVIIQPASMSITPGQSVEFVIAIEQASELFGFELKLDFDPSLIQVDDMDPELAGVQVELVGILGQRQGFTVVNQVDNQKGTLDYAMTLLAPAKPVSGASPLLSISARAIAPGDSPLSLSVLLASKDGLPLSVETFDGTLSVSNSPPLSGKTSPAPSTPVAGLVVTSATVIATPAGTNQSSTSVGNITPVRTAVVAQTGTDAGSGPPLSESQVTPGRSSNNELMAETVAENSDHLLEEKAEPSVTLPATPPDTSSGDLDAPAVESGLASAETTTTQDVTELDPDQSPSNQQSSETDSKDLQTILILFGVLLIISVGYLLARRLLAQR